MNTREQKPGQTLTCEVKNQPDKFYLGTPIKDVQCWSQAELPGEGIASTKLAQRRPSPESLLEPGEGLLSLSLLPPPPPRTS